MEKHFMIDIETTGVNQETDDILEIGIVEVFRSNAGYWLPTGREYHTYLYTERQPESSFAKEHQLELYARCNNANPQVNNLEVVGKGVRSFIHQEQGELEQYHKETPRYFMGWNASNFDMPFMFKKGLLTPSYYEAGPDGEEVLKGDAHYRIFEQAGSLQLICDMTGLSRDTIKALASDLSHGVKLPKGKAHDALYDCYNQIIMQNGLTAIGRMGINKFKI